MAGKSKRLIIGADFMKSKDVCSFRITVSAPRILI